MSRPPLRIANCSAFLGDRLSAAREMLEGGPIDFLTGDYLAELTMLILWKARAKDASLGYATTFLRQMEDCLGLAREHGVRIVANAGGLNPAGLAARLREIASRLGIAVRVAHVEGTVAFRERGLHVELAGHARRGGRPRRGRPLGGGDRGADTVLSSGQAGSGLERGEDEGEAHEAGTFDHGFTPWSS